MADEEDNIKERETFSEAQKSEAAAQDVAKDEEKPIEANTTIKEFNSFMSTTESMKTAARSKVETLISQVKEKLKPAKDNNKQLDDQDTEQSKADGLGMTNDEIEQHYIDALCDSVSQIFCFLFASVLLLMFAQITAFTATAHCKNQTSFQFLFRRENTLCFKHIIKLNQKMF